MSPKIVDKLQRKKEIALTALEVFAERGFESASISQVAEAAGIGKGTIYEYFESKEELIHESLLAWVDGMWRGAEGMLGGIEDPIERLRTFVNKSTDVFISDPRAIKLVIAMFQSLLAVEESFIQHDTIREVFSDFRKVIVDTLLDGVSRGVFRPEIARDAEKIAINLAAYLDGIALHYFMSRDFFDLKEQVNAYLEELVEGLKPYPTSE